MTERTRNRLVGATILLSLAVILLPMLFDGAGVERRNMAEWPDATLDIRPRDSRPPQEEDPATWSFVDEVQARRGSEPLSGLPQHRPLPETESAAQGAAGPDGSQTATAAEAVASPLPELDARGLPRAYSVQLAAFRDRDNARSLRQRLLDDGYDAYMIEERADDGVLHRVAVGPRIDRAAALRLQAELAERYQLEGMIVRFALGSGAGRGNG